MDNDYLPFHPSPSKPSFRPPVSAVDAHCHVFGPADRFPFAPQRKYTPVDAPAEKLFELRDSLGFARNVIVQATCHGTDNRALIDAIARSGGKARGVATVAETITGEELLAMHNAGIRGIRLNFVKRLVDAVPPEKFELIVRRIQELDWHTVVYFEAADLPDLVPFLARLPGIVVVDHMGRPAVEKGAEGADFGKFLDFLEHHPNFWVKVSCPERLTVIGPPYDDVVPFAMKLVEGFPDRVLWGTDWPHPNMRSHMPDDGKLVDFVPRIATTPELQRSLLVDNPMRMYWPEEKRD